MQLLKKKNYILLIDIFIIINLYTVGRNFCKTVHTHYRLVGNAFFSSI